MASLAADWEARLAAIKRIAESGPQAGADRAAGPDQTG
jgi:hypothetical protein